MTIYQKVKITKNNGFGQEIPGDNFILKIGASCFADKTMIIYQLKNGDYKVRVR